MGFRAFVCASAYPLLSSLVNVHGPNLHLDPGLLQVRDHAVELAKTSLLEELRNLNSLQPTHAALPRNSAKEQIHAKLKRLLPGHNSSALAAVERADGVVVTSMLDIGDGCSSPPLGSRVSTCSY